MPTWLDHVRAIRAAPDDDAPRLVCADWLGDRGDPRGELVALDVRLAHDRDDRALARRDELHRLHRATWIAPLVALGVTRPIVRRGFVGDTYLDEQTAKNLGAICRLEPITELTLYGDDPAAYAAAAAAAELAGIRRLHLHGGPATARLLDSPHLGALELVTLPEACRFGEALAGSALRPLHLELTRQPELLERLVGAPFLSGVEWLVLVDPTDAAIAAVAAAPPPRLQRISIEDRGAGGGDGAYGDWMAPYRVDLVRQIPEEHEHLDATFVPGRPRRVELRGTPQSIGHFVGSPAVTGVEELDLRVELHDWIAGALGRSRFLGALRRLRVPAAPGAQLALAAVEIVVDA